MAVSESRPDLSLEEMGLSSETQESVELKARFVTAEELEVYRKAQIKEGGTYHIARGMLASPHFEGVSESEHERMLGLTEEAGLTPYVRGYQAAATRNKLDQIGQITNLYRVDDPIMPRRKLTVAILTYPDGTAIDVPATNLKQLLRYQLDDPKFQDLPEAYQPYLAFEQAGHTFRLGDRVVVDRLFVGTIKAIWPRSGESPRVAILTTERHYVPDPLRPGEYAPKMGGERLLFLALDADRLAPAPAPDIFTSPIQVLDES